MTHWTDKRAAKAELSHALKANGWKIYGFKADESDSMADYWSPEDWEGIAEKNGFVLIVDQYSTGLSGKEIRKYNYNGATRKNNDKINKLQATVNDKAASESEKASAQKLIDKLSAKDTAPDYEVLEVYPTFAHKTPRACVWHIEKDGVIIVKGKGIYSLYSINDREGTKQAMKVFAEKLEKHIANDTELVAVEKQVKTKVTELVEVPFDGTFTDTTMIKLNDNFTGGFGRGAVLVYKSDWTTRKVFLKLGKKFQKLKDTTTNMLTLKNEDLEKWIADGSISIVELQEVEKVEVKTVYVKKKRTQKPISEEFQVETVQTEVNTETTPEAITNVETPTESNGITYKLNNEKNGVEIYFSEKPSSEIIESLKMNGFRWSRFNKCWYTKQSDKTIAFAQGLTGEKVESENETVEPFEYELPEYIDISQFAISEQTEKALIDNSLFGDRRNVGDQTKQLQETLQDVKSITIEVVAMTDNSYYKKKLIEGFNAFCERYSREMNNYLYAKAYTPSWVVTGRGNLNVNSYNKKQNRVTNKMLKVVEMLDKQKAVLNKYKNRFKAEQVAKLNDEIKRDVESNTLHCEFKTEKRKFLYYGYTYNTRAYISDNYFIMKMAGCFRIFENGTNKEVHSLKTTEKLTDAKAYVTYLEAQKVAV